jgi:hypothetical protein
VNETLVIDPVPNRLWGTYYGGSDYEYLYTSDALEVDGSGFLYIVGKTNSITDIASTGAYDVVKDPVADDAFLSKFNSSGTRVWATYYGGSDWDIGHAVSITPSGNIYFTGRTTSTTAIASTGAWDVTYGGNYDAFLVKFSSSGFRIWGTYYGGSGGDYPSGLSVDLNENVYLVGDTQSSLDIATLGAWDEILGSNDAFLVKFNSSGSRVWGTYYGGNGGSIGLALALDPLGNIYIVGRTTSTTSIASTGAWDESFSGGADCFLAKFNSSGSRIWGTYYGGSGWESPNALSVDANGNIYIVGNTRSFSDIATLGAWDVSFGGNDDVFLAKFNASGSRIWSTYYGGIGEDVGLGSTIDNSGNVYIIGKTKSSSDIASTEAWDVSYGGNYDVFLAKFTSSGSRLWGTYYGGNGDDVGISVAIENSSGNIYIAGYTNSSSDISSTGAWDTTLGGTSDVFFVKFDVTENQITSPTLPSNSYCKNQEFTLPYTVTGTYTSPNTFTAQLSDKNGSFTSPTTIGTKSSTSSGSISCTIPSTIETGSAYRIRIVSSNPAVTSSDNGTNITIHPTPQPVITGSASTCTSEQTTSYSVPQVTGHTYSWTPTVKGNIIGSQIGNAINVRWNVHGTDTLKLRQTNSTTGCFKDTTLVVTINPSPLPKITGVSSVCVDKASETYSVNLVSGNTYLWFAPTKGTIDGGASGNSVKIRWTTQGMDTLKIRETNPQTGCIKDTFIVITIQALPLPIITGQKTACLNSTQYDYAVSSIVGNTYEWTQPSKGNIIGSLTSNAIKVAWTSQGSDSLKVRQTNPVTGCSKDTFIVVTIQQVPKPTITGEAIICSKNTTSTFRVDSKSGYNITWSKPKNGRIIGSNSRDSVVVEWLSSGIDTVYARYTDAQTGCFEETKKAVLIGNPLTPSIQGSASTCIDTVPVTYRTRYQAGQSYGWSKPRLGTINGAINLDSVQIEWNASGQDTLTLREFTISTGCFKDTSLIITVNPRPQPSISGKSELVEYSQNNVYSVPNESGSSYEWSIVEGDADIEKKNGNSVELKAGKSGNVIIKVIQTTVDGCKNEAQYTITVKSATGITESRNKSFSVYPNPNNGQEELIVELPFTSLHEMRIELIDLLGIIRYERMIPSQSSRHVIQLSDMPKGMYTIRLITRDGVLSEKVIVE